MTFPRQAHGQTLQPAEPGRRRLRVAVHRQAAPQVEDAQAVAVHRQKVAEVVQAAMPHVQADEVELRDRSLGPRPGREEEPPLVDTRRRADPVEVAEGQPAQGACAQQEAG